MTDTYAPTAPAPTAPPPSQEAVINPQPTSIPTPIGSQAPSSSRPPDDMEGSTHRPQSRSEQRREIIKKAFQRTEDPGPAKPRMGHNNPPEEMQKEKIQPPPKQREARPHPESIDLRRPPPKEDAKTAQSLPPRARAEHGHFAPRQGQRGQNQGGVQQGQQFPRDPYYRPPPRISRQAQAEWVKAPASVRSEFYRMGREFYQAQQRSMADKQVMDSIRPYHELARQQGTTLAKALSNYVPMEHKLRTDPIGGLDLIVNNLNLRTADGQPITFRDVCYYVASQSPEQHQAVRTQNVQTAHQMQLAEVQRQNQALAQQISALHYQQRFTRVRSAVDDYATTHPRLDELAGPIERELKLGFDLDTAYKRADRLYPSQGSPRGSSGTAAQTRGVATSGNRSISGAPSSANGATHHPKFKTRRDVIAYNMRRVRGQL